MGSNFHERFKNKSSTISVTGSLTVDPENAILRPLNGQIHSNIIQNSGNYKIKSQSPPSESIKIPNCSNNSLINYSNNSEVPHKHSSKYKNKIFPFLIRSIMPHNSISPIITKRNQNQPLTSMIFKPQISKSNSNHLNKSYENQTKKEFTPYTIKDYHAIKIKTYYELGGLGPNIGTNEWIQKKKLIKKRLSYGKNVYYLNAAKLPFLPVKSFMDNKEEENSRTRALKFARNIVKPPLRNVMILE
ncbi:hypothetical protein SteCoe_33325 [Stentor coeruleus]|uniref:Uncharacterized protein n=1 Tax=Stentor coeruleus TaxID=5963 RepID=A0A1R2AX17_9CILI|nr:hypothetical protein SteCoe_33325 [Stentor coeruleus]